MFSYNLLLNACEAVVPDAGSIEVTLREVRNAVEIRVSDTGRGIPELIRGQLFEPFVSHGKENGTGLGLTVVQKIVQDHGGDVIVEKTSAAGTVFRVLLPLASSAESVPERREGERREEATVARKTAAGVGFLNRIWRHTTPRDRKFQQRCFQELGAPGSLVSLLFDDFLLEATCETHQWFAWPDGEIRRRGTAHFHDQCSRVGTGGTCATSPDS